MAVDIDTEVEEAAQFWTRQQERSSHDIGLTMLVITDSGERVVIGFTGGMTDDMRPVLGQTVRGIVGAPIAAFVSISTAWYSTRLDVRPRDDPQAGEVLMVYGSNRQGQRATRAYQMLRFGDEIRLQLMDWKMADTYSPTYEQIFEEDEQE
jgi:hypothetical protein